MNEIYALDIETTGLSRFKDSILCVGVYSPRFNKCFDSAADFAAWHKSHLHEPLYITHNGSFDIGFLRHSNLDLRNNWFSDTKSIASIFYPRPASLGLEHLTELYLGYPPYKLNRENMQSYSRDELKDYCLKDCRYTWELWEFFNKKLDGKAKAFIDSWLMPATRFCSDMEYDGVFIDQKGLAVYSDAKLLERDRLLFELQELAKQGLIAYHEKQVREVSKIYKELYEKAKEKAKSESSKNKCLNRYAELESRAISRVEQFNWNSPKQLLWLLKDYYNLNVENRDNEDSTAEAVLRSIDHPVCKKLCDYREIEKLVSTCIPALKENCSEDGLIHAHYHIGGTRTGRLSSSSPNLQQIPRGPIRSYVRSSSESRVLATIDYSQIEVRIIAEVSQEQELINAFKQEIDPYSIIAKKLLNISTPVKEIKEKHKKERDVSKTAGLSILYGTGARKLQEVLKKELGRTHSISECKKFIDDYRNSFKQLKRFKLSLESRLANAKVCQNLLGRPFIIESNDDLYMQALNTLVQGSASDLVMHSAIKVKERLAELGVDAQCRLLIHDEQVWELPADEAEILVKEVIVPAMTTEIEKELSLTVPLKVEYSINRVWEKP